MLTSSRTGYVGVSADEICGAIHKALIALPMLSSPKDVPFLDGLYFFYEEGEASRHAPQGRIVRVGNHPRSQGSLRRRINQHYSGRKNGSAFRKLLGGALLRSRAPESACLLPGPGKGHWERQYAKPCDVCRTVEEEVSTILRQSFRFRCVMVRDRVERNELEAALIGALSHCSVCGPSPAWLGRYAYSHAVRCSGLWNSEFVGHSMADAQLERFQQLVTSSAEFWRK